MLRIDLNQFRRNGWVVTQGNGYRIVLHKSGMDNFIKIFDGTDILNY